jgi:hypothetical protein
MEAGRTLRASTGEGRLECAVSAIFWVEREAEEVPVEAKILGEALVHVIS